MALNPDKVGSTYPPYLYEVAREKIREYALALGETDPRYHSDGDDCVAPPTFAACFTLARGAEVLLGDPDLGAHTRLVHASQQFAFGDRPLRPGDRLRCTPKVAEVTTRGDNEMLTLEVECLFEESGALAVRATSLLVLLGDDPAASGQPASGDAS